MNHSFKLLFTASALSLLAACGNNTSSTGAETSNKAAELTSAISAPTTLAVDAYRPAVAVAAQPAAVSSTKPLDPLVTPTATNIALGAPLASQTTAAQKHNADTAEDNMGKPLQIGFGREVAQTSTPAATQQLLKWKATASGSQVAAINFNSTGAKGIRVGLLVTQLPETATLRFYAKGAATAFEVKGSEVLAVLAKNLAAGDKSDAGRTYWGPSVEGVDATVEIEIPAGVAASSVSVSVPAISHMYMSNQEIHASIAETTYSSGRVNRGLSCQVDVTCSSPVPAATDAVAYLNFIDKNPADGLYYSYICSGTLLNDNINSATPYLLTANHCFSSQTASSTLTSEFKYRSLTCNNTTAGEYYATTGGADLLYTAYATDSTLVKLRNSPTTSGLLYAGWDATTPPAVSTAVHSVHHPRGDQQRLSRGTVTNYSVRSSTNANGFFSSDITNGTILDVTLTTGLTEGGSSGSSLLKGTDSNPIVIGQLYGGSTAVCGQPKYNVYGRFDVAFNSGMKDWLVQGLKPVYRFYNNSRGTHFFSQSITEKNFISANYPQFSFENAVFNAYSNPDTVNATVTRSPVFRFYNSATQSHFYTIDVAEKDAIVAKISAGIWPQYAFEGTSWYGKTAAQFTSAPDGTIPLYRFYRTNGTHFYTASATEKASIQANLSAYYTYEGIAYYVWP